MKVRCTGIRWDTGDSEGRVPKLPKTITLTVPPLRENEDQESLTEELADMLSDKTGWAVESFNFEIVRH